MPPPIIGTVIAVRTINCASSGRSVRAGPQGPEVSPSRHSNDQDDGYINPLSSSCGILPCASKAVSS